MKSQARRKRRRATDATLLEEVGLLHDSQELLFVHLSISIAIGFVNHFLKLLVSHALAELLRDSLQVLEGDLAGLVIIEEAECLQDLVFGIPVQDLMSHHFQELLVANGATSIVVDIGDHLLDLLLLGLKAKCTHGDLQLLGVDLSRAIGVEEVEGLLDLLLLLLGQFLLLLATCVETTKSHCYSRDDFDNQS